MFNYDIRYFINSKFNDFELCRDAYNILGLTSISGVRPGDLDDGKSLPVVIQQVKAIQVDIELLGLVKGTDYSDIVELSKMFETPNPRYGNMFFCTLKHKADILLGKGNRSESISFHIQLISEKHVDKMWF